MLTGTYSYSLRFCSCLIGCSLNHTVCRSAAVDSRGRELNRNRLIALMAAIVLEEVRFFSELQF
jgi:hypothetical protein